MEQVRTRNTTVAGHVFTEEMIEAVWQKGTIVPGQDPDLYRKDSCGAWLKRTEFGAETKYGWEVDHRKPVIQTGTDDLSNLQPLHWQNNLNKGDHWPLWDCTVFEGEKT